MTPYEKESYSLTVQFLRELGVDEAILQKSSKMSDLEKLIVANDFLEKLNTEKGLMLMSEYEREMKEAEKLKTGVDFQRDKEKKAEAERQKQIEIAKEKERQIQTELEDKEKEKKERYNNSDYVHIGNAIKKDFNQWLQKGEFEKTEDYQNRISNNSSKVFDSICLKNLANAVFKVKSDFSSNLLKYNPDTEKFGIEFTFNGMAYNDSISIPIDIAPKFKDDIQNFQIYVDDKDWKFIDNYLTPTKITFFNNYKKIGFEFYFTNKDFKNIYFSTSELGLDSLTNLNTKFNIEQEISTSGQIVEVSSEKNIQIEKAYQNAYGNSSGVSVVRGLSGRKPIHFPNMQDDFNENAKVYVDIKVDASGKVTSAEISRGTTTSNSSLRNIATQKAYELKFPPAQSDIESGTILFIFVSPS
ncbi:MAG TPA: hypothetical protein VIJ75_09360 [Hanamia sp.]